MNINVIEDVAWIGSKYVEGNIQGYPESLEAVLSEHSPIEQVAALPDIPYRIIHGENDPAVSKQNHSDKMVAAMREQGLSVEYAEVSELKHVCPIPLRVLEENITFVTKAMNQSA